MLRKSYLHFPLIQKVSKQLLVNYQVCVCDYLVIISSQKKKVPLQKRLRTFIENTKVRS